MSLILREPFRDFEDSFNRMLTRPFKFWPRWIEADNGRAIEWAPTADISETEREFVVKAELPGVKRDDVHVSVAEGVITIKGERKYEKEDKNEKQHRTERFYGSFERSFALPDNVDAGAIKAESKDGVLTVRLPKTKVEKPKAIEVSVQ